MEVQPDFKDLFELFNVHEVKYMIVGGYALAFYGAPRYTGNIDGAGWGKSIACFKKKGKFQIRL